MDFSKEFIELHETPLELDDLDNSNYKSINEEDDDIKNIKTKKEKKKSKKKRDKFDFMFDLSNDEEDLFNSSILNEDEDSIIFKKGKKGAKKDLFDLKEAKKKRKKSIEAKFLPEINELKKILKDANVAYTDIREILKNITESKSKYVGKTLTDLLQAMNSANTNRMNIVQHIANIKKSVTDLTLKQEKNNPKKDDILDEDAIGLDIFRSLLGSKKGRKELMKDASNFFTNKNKEKEEDFENEFDIIDDNDDVDDIINSRLHNEDNVYRKDDGNKYIEYEDREPVDCIIYHPNNEWEIDAIDKNGEFMPKDYPRMKKEDLGNVSFDLEQNRARDEYGRLYKVIQY